MNADKYDEALSRASKELFEQDFDSLDFYKDIKYVEPDIDSYIEKDRRETGRTFRISRMTLVASVLILVLSVTFGIWISNGTVSAAKFKVEQQVAMIKNNLYHTQDYSVEDDTITLKIMDPTEIKSAAEFFPGLFPAKNIPERFQFVSLTVNKSSRGVYVAEYVYVDNNGAQLSIMHQTVPERGSFSFSMVNVTQEVKTDDGTVYLSEDPAGDGTNAASYVTETDIISISGLASVEEIKKMYGI